MKTDQLSGCISSTLHVAFDPSFHCPKVYSQECLFFSFLRSVAYREFIRMVYGILGNRRVPLPACAYHEIRTKFPATTDESFTGFEMDEEDA